MPTLQQIKITVTGSEVQRAGRVGDPGQAAGVHVARADEAEEEPGAGHPQGLRDVLRAEEHRTRPHTPARLPSLYTETGGKASLVYRTLLI